MAGAAAAEAAAETGDLVSLMRSMASDGGDGSRVGRALQMAWKPPLEAGGAVVEDFKAATEMVASNPTRIAAAQMPYHPLVMAGRYHTFKIDSKFPVPGGAIEDDKRRRAGVVIAQRADTAGTKERARMEVEADQHARAAAMVFQRRNPELPWREYDELPVVQREKAAAVAAEKVLQRAAAPRWPSTESFPISDAERGIFQLIKDNAVDELRVIFGRRDIPLNAADESTMTTGLMKCAMLGREEMLKVCQLMALALPSHCCARPSYNTHTLTHADVY